MQKFLEQKEKCEICNKLDDELHFFLDCTRNQNLRKEFFDSIYNISSSFITMDKLEKLKFILNPSTPTEIKAVSSFIKRSLELRKGDS